MPKILSIDPGLANTGYASIEYGDTQQIRLGRAFGVLHTTQEDGSDRERIDKLNVEISKIVLNYQPDAIGIEDWSYMGNRGKNESSMPALIENLRQLCRELNVPTYIYENPVWKKATLGIRTANKKQIQHFVSKRITDAPTILHRKPDHVWDSVGICFAVYKNFIGGQENERIKDSGSMAGARKRSKNTK